MGNLGPSLEGVGQRLSEEQLRARLIDSRKINPMTIMPPYFSTEGLSLVDPKLSGKTILSATELEDVLAYLKSLL
jgi:sulfur-oxidizing protein SoxX